MSVCPQTWSEVEWRPIVAELDTRRASLLSPVHWDFLLTWFKFLQSAEGPCVVLGRGWFENRTTATDPPSCSAERHMSREQRESCDATRSFTALSRAACGDGQGQQSSTIGACHFGGWIGGTAARLRRTSQAQRASCDATRRFTALSRATCGDRHSQQVQWECYTAENLRHEYLRRQIQDRWSRRWAQGRIQGGRVRLHERSWHPESVPACVGTL